MLQNLSEAIIYISPGNENPHYKAVTTEQQFPRLTDYHKPWIISYCESKKKPTEDSTEVHVEDGRGDEIQKAQVKLPDYFPEHPTIVTHLILHTANGNTPALLATEN